MVDPSFNGLFLFGHVSMCRTVPIPPAIQMNTYPGVNGCQVLRHGSRGGITEITGLLTGPNEAGIALSMEAILAFVVTATEGIFVDDLNRARPRSFISRFEPVDRMVQLADGSGFAVAYTATIQHLI